MSLFDMQDHMAPRACQLQTAMPHEGGLQQLATAPCIHDLGVWHALMQHRMMLIAAPGAADQVGHLQR